MGEKGGKGLRENTRSRSSEGGCMLGFLVFYDF